MPVRFTNETSQSACTPPFSQGSYRLDLADSFNSDRFDSAMKEAGVSVDRDTDTGVKSIFQMSCYVQILLVFQPYKDPVPSALFKSRVGWKKDRAVSNKEPTPVDWQMENDQVVKLVWKPLTA